MVNEDNLENVSNMDNIKNNENFQSPDNTLLNIQNVSKDTRGKENAFQDVSFGLQEKQDGQLKTDYNNYANNLHNNLKPKIIIPSPKKSIKMRIMADHTHVGGSGSKNSSDSVNKFKPNQALVDSFNEARNKNSNKNQRQVTDNDERQSKNEHEHDKQSKKSNDKQDDLDKNSNKNSSTSPTSQKLSLNEINNIIGPSTKNFETNFHLKFSMANRIINTFEDESSEPFRRTVRINQNQEMTFDEISFQNEDSLYNPLDTIRETTLRDSDYLNSNQNLHTNEDGIERKTYGTNGERKTFASYISNKDKTSSCSYSYPVDILF